MDVAATTLAPVDVEADTVAIGVFAGKRVAHDLEGGPLQALLDAGEARAKAGHLAVTHAAGRRWILVGLGDRDRFDAEKGRMAAARLVPRLRELGTRTLCWELPHRLDDLQAAAFAEGTILGAYSFTEHKSAPDPEPELGRLVLSDHADRSAAAHRGQVVAEAANAARRLQETASNVLTPVALAEWARRTLVALGVQVEVTLGRQGLRDLGMGSFAAVADGSDQDAALIVARYRGGTSGPVLGLVGKAVTHDTGGLSIKPAGSMDKMKFDMSGGAAVLGALAAVARLELPGEVLAVVGATENTINGRAMKPGDVVTAMDGTTIEVNNTDAEGRLVLCDCLTHARRLGAERLVDVATLTGGVVTALGEVHAGLFANDDPWAQALLDAGTATAERLWRLPLHEQYAEVIEGRYADLVNSPPHKKGHAISGAEFLHHFVGDVPWAHLDIAGVAYDSPAGRPWAAKGGTGFGVRLLTELVERTA